MVTSWSLTQEVAGLQVRVTFLTNTLSLNSVKTFREKSNIALHISLRIFPFSAALIIFTIELGFFYALFTFQFETAVDVKSVCSKIGQRNNMQFLLYL